MKILVHVQDCSYSTVVCDVLKDEGYEASLFKNFEEYNLKEVVDLPVCLIIELLDHSHEANLSLIQKFRTNMLYTPLLALVPSSVSKEQLKEYLEAGIDDYIKKPLNLDELVIRLKILLKPKVSKVSSKICIGDLQINPLRKEIYYKDELLQLTAKEYSLLEYFAKNPGVVLSRSQISANVWDMDFEQNSNVVDVYVGYLRTKLDKKFGVNMIKTIRGHGYMFEMPQLAEKSQDISAISDVLAETSSDAVL